jgi:hypothetical protein
MKVSSRPVGTTVDDLLVLPAPAARRGLTATRMPQGRRQAAVEG